MTVLANGQPVTAPSKGVQIEKAGESVIIKVGPDVLSRTGIEGVNELLLKILPDGHIQVSKMPDIRDGIPALPQAQGCAIFQRAAIVEVPERLAKVLSGKVKLKRNIHFETQIKEVVTVLRMKLERTLFQEVPVDDRAFAVPVSAA